MLSPQKLYIQLNMNIVISVRTSVFVSSARALHKMAAMKLYFVFVLLFAFACAAPISEEEKVITTTPPAPDGSYIEVYQKNQYHNDGRPATLITVYKRCTQNGICKNIHYLEIALDEQLNPQI